jgi:hypothetical protein
MKFPILRLLAVLSIGSTIMVSAPTAASGGGDDSPPAFNSPWGPVLPLSALASGGLGVVEASWWRKPLLLAWYRFNGQALPAGGLEAFSYRPPTAGSEQSAQAILAWQTAAKEIASADAPEHVAAESALLGGNRWDRFENCPADAWQQARQTLNARVSAWGANHPALQNWLTAQHRVFARCPLGPAYFRRDLPGGGEINPQYAQQFLLPDMALPDPSADAPTLLIQDRAYQRASALLYEGHYQEAEAAFTAIAGDAASPWQAWGHYLALRAGLRNAQLLAPNGSYDPCEAPECVARRTKAQTLREAESARLRAAATRALTLAQAAGRHDEARRLRDLLALIGARLDPAKRFRELAAILHTPGVDAAEFQRAADDYLLLHRQFAPSEPLGEWLAGLVNGDDPTRRDCHLDSGATAPRTASPDRADSRCRRQQWSLTSLQRFEQAPKDHAWLFSAAVFATRDAPHLTKLLDALARVPADHPGAASFLLQRLRLGPREEGLHLATQLMARDELRADYSARNRVREYRLWHATSLADFWRDALREEGRAYDRDTLLQTAPPAADAAPAWGWDADTSWILNYELPHAALMASAQHPDAPTLLRRVAARLAWSRGLLRHDSTAAREALSALAKIDGPAFPPQLAALLRIEDEQRFFLEGGLLIDGARVDPLCRLTAPATQALDLGDGSPSQLAPLGRFARNILSSEHYAAWQQERQALETLPDLDSIWMQNVLDFARHFPTDARVPGLLREAVYRTRMNWCADASAGDLSREAFDLLKRSYPKSKEARTTKYWFKPRS